MPQFLSQTLLASQIILVPQCTTDSTFGPFSDCRFDFTLLFEQCVLSGIPSVLLLLASLIRITHLRRQDQKTAKNRVGVFKLILAVIYTLLQLVVLVLWIRASSLRIEWSIFVSVVNVAAGIIVIPLCYLEHARSVRPSAVLEVYLLFSSLLDLPQVRTLFLINKGSSLGGLLLTTIACKLVLLSLEVWQKTSYLRPQYQQLSPEWLSGVVNSNFFWWLNSIFSPMYLDFYDQYHLDPALATKHVGKKMLSAWNQRSASKERFPLIWATYYAFRGSFAHVLLPRLCLIAFTFAQPFLITSVLELLQNTEDENSDVKGYFLIAATLFIYLGIALTSLQSTHALNRFVVIFRGATEYLLYDKTLMLKTGTYDESSAVTLMGADIDRIVFCLTELNECWSRTIEIGIGLPLLTRQLGWVSIVPLLVVGLSTIGSSVIANHIGKSQREWSDATQRRIKVTSSMLKEMRSIKMTGLATIIGDLVQKERVKETKKMEARAWMMVWLNVFANIPVVLAPAATFGVYAVQAAIRGSESLNTVKAFTSLALISLVSYPASRLLSAIPGTAASIGCFDRIQEFLLAESHKESRLVIAESFPPSNEPDSDTGYIEYNSTAMSNTTLPVANVPAISIQNATIKPLKTVDFVLRAVNLRIKKGSFTIIAGPVGVGKTTLLKAITGEIGCSTGTITVREKHVGYCSQIPWLVNGSIKESICGLENEDVDELWYQTVLSACELTYDISKLPAGDKTIIGSRGVALSGGQKHRIAIARAIYTRSGAVILDDVLSALDKNTESSLVSKLFSRNNSPGVGLLRKLECTVILVSHSTQVLPLADQIITIGLDGSVQCRRPEDTDQSEIDSDATTETTETPESVSPGKVEEIVSNTSKAKAETEIRDIKRQTEDWAVYKYYFRSIGLRKMIIFLIFTLIYVFSGSFSQIWLKWWTDQDGRHVVLYASIYLLFAIGYSAGMGGYAWAISVVIAPSTGRKLHRVLLETVLRAPQSFFTATDLGSILNRFAQDMSLIEGPLAVGLLVTTTNLFSTLAEAALIATGSPFVIIALPPLFSVMYYLQKVYLQTSRQLRHLELESRSPLYTHFLETLEGISTIRAFGCEREFRDLFTKHVDDSQKPYYLMFCIQNWLRLVLDLISGGMAVILVILALNLRHWTSPGLLGVAMNNLLSFNLSLSAVLSGWTMLETSLGAIARLKDFETETEIEDKATEVIKPPKGWPTHGLLEFDAVSAEYNDSVKALKNISLNILPGQRVSICGRTGSGKSTLLSTVLRLQDLTQGSIRIDSLDISQLQRSSIRQQITSIPQDALHVPGTLRFNTDPFGLCTDAQIISVLNNVDLWQVLSERGGLNAQLLPDSLSKGQFQLLALARALLQRRKLVLMDEATSSIDLETARKINNMMETEFLESTVLTVAHRKETILRSEVVIVMDQGEVVETGDPEILMGKEGSRLRALLQDGADYD